MPSSGIRAGAYRQRVKFQRPVSTRDPATGKTSTTWIDVGTYWANVRTVSSKESVIAGQLRLEAEYAIDMRYVAGIDPTYRAVWLDGGVTFELVSVRNPDSRKIKLSLFGKVVKDA